MGRMRLIWVWESSDDDPCEPHEHDVESLWGDDVQEAYSADAWMSEFNDLDFEDLDSGNEPCPSTASIPGPCSESCLGTPSSASSLSPEGKPVGPDADRAAKAARAAAALAQLRARLALAGLSQELGQIPGLTGCPDPEHVPGFGPGPGLIAGLGPSLNLGSPSLAQAHDPVPDISAASAITPACALDPAPSSTTSASSASSSATLVFGQAAKRRRIVDSAMDQTPHQTKDQSPT